MDSKMKIVAAAALMSVLAVVGSAYAAEEAAEESAVSATLDLTALNSYVWRGQVLNDEAVLQPSLTVAKNGFAINWWGNYNLTDNVTGDEFEFSEHDIGLSYSALCPFTGANMTLGIVNYDFPNQFTAAAADNISLVADTAEAYFSAAFTEVLLAPTLSVYYDLKEADGFYGSLAISHAIALADAISLNLGASIGGSDSDWGSYYFGDVDANFTDYSLSATLPVAVGDSWTITPGIQYTSLVNDAEDAVNDNPNLYFGETDQFIGSVKASYAF